jgi:hypothetical protein
VEEESAGSSCDVEKRIVEGRVEEDEGLLIRFNAWDWVFGENNAKADANRTRLFSEVGRGGVVVRRAFSASASKLEELLTDVAMSTDGNNGAVEFDPPAIAVVSLFVAARGGAMPVIVEDLKGSDEKMRQMLSAGMKVGGERSERRVPPSHASQLLLRTDHGLDT